MTFNFSFSLSTRLFCLFPFPQIFIFPASSYLNFFGGFWEIAVDRPRLSRRRDSKPVATLFLRHAALAGRSPSTRRGVPSYLRGIARAATLSVPPSAAQCGPFAAVSRSERATSTVRGIRHPSGRVRRGSRPFFPCALYSLVCAEIIHRCSVFRVTREHRRRVARCWLSNVTSRRIDSARPSGFDRVILSGRVHETHFRRRHSSVSLTFSRYVLANTRADLFLHKESEREREREREGWVRINACTRDWSKRASTRANSNPALRSQVSAWIFNSEACDYCSNECSRSRRKRGEGVAEGAIEMNAARNQTQMSIGSIDSFGL